LSAYYFAAFNPKGLVLFATAAYAYLSFGFAALTIVTIFDESKIAIQPVGWNQSNGIECKEEYFILRFEDEEQLKQGEKYFLKAILNYPQNQDISQDQNATSITLAVRQSLKKTLESICISLRDIDSSRLN
jgi:hypothetical protein